MNNTSNQLINQKDLQQTALMILQKCTDQKTSFNQIVKIEQDITIAKSIEEFPLINKQGEKMAIVIQIIRIIEFFLEVTGKTQEIYQIQVLAGNIFIIQNLKMKFMKI